MIKFLAKHIKWIIALVGVLAFSVTQTQWLQISKLWQKTQGALIDRRFLLRAERPAHPEICLIGVATSSFKLDALWPEEIAASETLQLMQSPLWDRRIYAAILEKLISADAKVVVFDFVFASQTAGDDVFARALQKYKDRVVIGELRARIHLKILVADVAAADESDGVVDDEQLVVHAVIESAGIE